ncbi:acyltransferase family protein [Cylindrospermum stagnale PCC 7417]|uniref:Acyltransferase family protein n=1 Tax=Cylindrospermum stagnale PCC 7417 TaxID=56107 RepID=K9X6F2_9NOST|nr:acyltransferase [Cylindrospermum stagnale]AFZ27651.1 acyltransferase family protein [Cylindrospermum stagnale PCC 7417]
MKHPLEQTQSAKRDIRFDILKTISILCIILAHVIPEDKILFHLRNFDVPLMVITSGTLFYYSNNNREYSLFLYLQRRIPRLIAPVWFFLSFYFILTYLIFSLLNKNYPFSLQEIINGFILLNGTADGTGYVWIIRVFMIMAIISTSILNLYRACQGKRLFLILLLVSYLCYEVTFKLVENIKLENKLALSFINSYFLYLIPYGCLFGLGITLPKMSRKLIASIAGIFSIVFSLLAIYYYYKQGVMLFPQNFKYPPRLYYLSYGIFMSMLAFLVVDKLCVNYNLSEDRNFVMKTIVFISSSTLWIYLWHILFLFYWKKLVSGFLPTITNNFVISFMVISCVSITVTYVQKKSFLKIINNTQFGQNNSEILTTLFLK